MIEILRPGQLKSAVPPAWPPDAFAIVASILRKSAAYVQCGQIRRSKRWRENMQAWGLAWRASSSRARALATEEVNQRWATVIRNQNIPLERLEQNGELCDALLEIIALADEASVGIGIDDRSDDLFLEKAGQALIDSGYRTLCKQIDISRVCVLPKLHTPQSGMTLRSLTHHLAISDTGEVVPYWFNCITRDDTQRKQLKASLKQDNIHSLNLLLVPWPEVIRPADFRDAGPVADDDENHRYFTYTVRSGERLQIDTVLDLLQKGKDLVGRIDGVIFPEMALKHGEELTLYEKISKRDRETFLVAGIVHTFKNSNRPSRNSCVFLGRRYASGKRWPMREDQAKHHRWRLDKRQIIQYGLGGQLDPESFWWEYTQLERRKLNFFVLRSWLTVCVLLCEDLARQDPVSDLVRAVGPNLVIALLMDGPQLEKRWSARYATVLADDPGSSVLTLTSLGMTQLCRPPNESVKRTIALWKDARMGTVPIDLPLGSRAMVLTLTKEQVEELTADSRSDRKTTDYLILSGCHALSA
jgi:hypothetical protein